MTPGHEYVLYGIGSESQVVVGRGGSHWRGSSLPGLRTAIGGGVFLQLRVLKGGCPGDIIVRIRDLGDDFQYGADPRRLTPQGGPTIDGDATILRYGKVAVLTDFGGSDGGNGAIRGGDVLPTHQEHHIPIHSNSYDIFNIISG